MNFEVLFCELEILCVALCQHLYSSKALSVTVCAFVFISNKILSGYLGPELFVEIMKINNFRGDQTCISAHTALVPVTAGIMGLVWCRLHTIHL